MPPRTQQSALKSTGGKAERRPIPKRRRSAKDVDMSSPQGSPPPSMPPPSIQASASVAMAPVRASTRPKTRGADVRANWCYSCVDGGDLLSCVLCDRAICTKTCVKLPISFKEYCERDFEFVCPTCHSDHYFKGKKTFAPYYGLYQTPLKENFEDNVKAYPSRPAIVEGPFFLKHAASQANLKNFLILHFRLEGIATVGSPTSVLLEFLHGYFNNPVSLKVEEIEFNLDGDDAAESHSDKIQDVMNRIMMTDWANIWVIISTHSDQDRGDLFFCPNGADVVPSFFEHVLTDRMQAFLHTKKTTCFMLACGALVKYKEPQAGLLEVFQSYNFNHLFAFSVDGLIPSLLSSFFLDFAQVTILEGMDVSFFLDRGLLLSSSALARHTSLIHLDVGEDGPRGFRYDWAQSDVRPWGDLLPAQCPDCFAIRPFEKLTKGDDGPIRFKCKGWHSSDGSACGKYIIAKPPLGATRVRNSCWIKSPWPPAEQE